MVRISKQLLDGNVETLILAVLESGPSYGYAIVKEIDKRSKGILQLGEGTIYPVLYRLEEKHLVSASWHTAENTRRRKYYRLNPPGRKALAENRRQWEALAAVMRAALRSSQKLAPKSRLKGATI
jgi:PadR family transcriptional regulator PadR